MSRTRSRMVGHLNTGRHELMHWLYDPAALGRKAYRIRFPWLHIHIIPGSWINRSCDRYDRSVGATEDEIRRTRPTG